MGPLDALEGARDAVGDARVVLLPDVTVDHYVHVGDLDTFEEAVDRAGDRGGATLETRHHEVRVGGDSARTAVALARLGVPVALAAPTDPLGLHLLEMELGGLDADLEAVTTGTRASTTVALEFHGDRRADVDLTDPGPLEDLAPEDLPPSTWELVNDADAAVVTSWNRCREGGRALLRRVVEEAGEGTTTWFDPGDPTVRPEDVEGLLEDPALEGLDVLALNGHEARRLARAVGAGEPGDGVEAARVLARELPPRVDVHTEDANVTAQGSDLFERPPFPLEPQVRTGGGCAWNAGNLLGTLLELEPRHRLAVAHATAVAFLEDPHARYPHLEEVRSVLRERSPVDAS